MKKLFIFLTMFLIPSCVSDDNNNFYGAWYVDKPLFIEGRLGDLDKVYKTIKDFNFYFAEDKFELNGDIIIQHPYYDKERWNKNTLFHMTKGSAQKPITFEDLDVPIDHDTIISVTVKENREKKYDGSLVPGLYFFVIDKDTIILYWRGQYFSMKRRRK